MTDRASAPRLTRFAQRGHARLAYEPVTAPGDAPAVLLLHDLLDDRSCFADLRAALAGGEPPLRLVLPEMRGHGASAALVDRRFTLSDLTADIVAVLDAETIARAYLVGYGLGATVALETARLAPERVAGIVLVAPMLASALANDPHPARRAVGAAAEAQLRAVVDAAYKDLTDRALDLLLAPRLGATWRDQMPRPRLAAMRRHAGAMAPLLNALVAARLTAGQSRSVAAPALLVQTASGQERERVVMDWLAEQLPAVQLVALGDPAPATAPLGGEMAIELARQVRAFVAEVEAAADELPE